MQIRSLSNQNEGHLSVSKKGSRDIKPRFKNGEVVKTVRLGTQALNVKIFKILLTRTTSAMFINFLGARF
jgi:hypothetical protein